MTSQETVRTIISITKSSLKKNESLFKVCKKIKQTVESEFDGNWYCNAFYDKIGFNYEKYDQNFFVKLDFGKLSINAQKVSDKVSVRPKFFPSIFFK
jgi:hypothetical protein